MLKKHRIAQELFDTKQCLLLLKPEAPSWFGKIQKQWRLLAGDLVANKSFARIHEIHSWVARGDLIEYCWWLMIFLKSIEQQYNEKFYL